MRLCNPMGPAWKERSQNEIYGDSQLCSLPLLEQNLRKNSHLSYEKFAFDVDKMDLNCA